MDRLRVLLPAVIGVVLLGSFLLVPTTDPPDEYTVSVEQGQFGHNVTEYSDLSSDYRQVFDAARENGGTVTYTGQRYPDGVDFPSSNGLTSRSVTHENARYFVQFTHQVIGPGAIGILRMLGSLAGGTVLLAYAGYRHVAA